MNTVNAAQFHALNPNQQLRVMTWPSNQNTVKVILPYLATDLDVKPHPTPRETLMTAKVLFKLNPELELERPDDLDMYEVALATDYSTKEIEVVEVRGEPNTFTLLIGHQKTGGMIPLSLVKVDYTQQTFSTFAEALDGVQKVGINSTVISLHYTDHKGRVYEVEITEIL